MPEPQRNSVRWLDIARIVVRTTLLASVIGLAVLFAALFAATFTSERSIERVAQAYLRSQVEQSARERFGDRTDTLLSVAKNTGALGAALAMRADSLRRLAESDWPERVAQILDLLCCTDDGKVDRAALIRDGIDNRLANVESRLGVLQSFVVGAYQARLHALVRELRLFAGVNAALFAIVGVLLYANRSNMQRVLLPSVVLLASTLTAATLYVTTQDWFWTILLGDYMGAWYVALVAMTTAFAADVILLKARVSLELLSHIPAALIPPC